MNILTHKFKDDVIAHATGDSKKVTFTINCLNIDNPHNETGNWVIDLSRDDVNAMSEHLYFCGVSVDDDIKIVMNRINRHSFSDPLIEDGHGNDERIQLIMRALSRTHQSAYTPNVIEVQFTVGDMQALASHFAVIDKMKFKSRAPRSI